MNNTNTSFDDETSSFQQVTNDTTGYKTLEWKIKLVFNIVFLIIAVVSNFAVIVVVYCNKTTPKSPYEHFICNVSLSSILALPGYLLFFLETTVSFLFCKIFYPTVTVATNATLYFVTAIAVVRCRVILNPFKTKPSTRQIYATIAGIWVLGHVYVIPMYIVIQSDKHGKRCIEHWSSQIYNQLYTVALTLLQYVIPLAILAVCYTRIILYLKRHKVPQSDLNSDRINQLKMIRKRNVEVIRISAIIVFLHIIFTLPSHIAWITMVFGNDNISRVVFRFSNESFLFYYCCNPFVYGFASSQSRMRMYNFFKKCFPRKNTIGQGQGQGQGQGRERSKDSFGNSFLVANCVQFMNIRLRELGEDTGSVGFEFDGDGYGDGNRSGDKNGDGYGHGNRSGDKNGDGYGHGDRSGDKNGDGYGHGNRSGDKNGDGYGHGDRSGDKNGDGYGHGNRSGDKNGDGYGHGNRSGDKNGDGYGHGNRSGDRSGDKNGDGYGHGDRSGDGYGDEDMED